MSHIKRWKILAEGPIAGRRTNDVEYTCTHCWNDALLPVVGVVIAQCDQALVFDSEHAMPERIRCPHCRVTLERANVR